MLAGAILIIFAGCSSGEPIDPGRENGTEANRVQPSPSDAQTANGQVANGQTAVAKLSTTKLIELAQQELTQGEVKAAQDHLKQALLQTPNNAEAIFLAAQASASQGDLDTGISLLEQIPVDDRHFGVAAAGQTATWLATLGQVHEARSVFRDLLGRAPDEPFVRHQFADFLNMVGWRSEAVSVLDPLVSAGEASESELRALLRVSEAYAVTQDRGSGHRQQGPIGAALGYLSNRQPRNAAERLTSYLQSTSYLESIDQPDAAATAMLASAMTDLQQFDEAAALLAQAAFESRKQPHYWQAIGNLATHKGDKKQAVGAYLQALRIDPTNPITHERLVSALVRLGKNEAANKIDLRRTRLLAAVTAGDSVGVGNSDDLRAGLDLVSDLQALGQPKQAAAWLEIIAARHLASDATRNAKARIENLRAIPEDESNRQRLCGLNPAAFPVDDARYSARTRTQPRDSQTLRPDKSESPAPRFVNVAAATGVEFTYRNAEPPREKNLRIFESFGGGVVAIDFDLDGNVDLYFAQGGDPTDPQRQVSNSLFRSLGDRYREISHQADVGSPYYSMGMTTGDLNQDGFPDLVVGNLGVNQVFLNQGDGSFVDATDGRWTDETFTTGVAIADVTGDGLPDVVEMNYTDDADVYAPLVIDADGHALMYPGPLDFRSAADRVWVSEADGVLRPRTLGRQSENESPEIGDAANPGLGLVVTDLDGKPGLEIFVGNDARPNQLWRHHRDQQRRNSVFKDYAILAGCAFSSRGEATACMGIAQADFDGNGRPDLLITNWYDEWVNFYRQRDDGVFEDLAVRYQLDLQSENLLGFGTQAIDFDNDSWIDVVIGNGHVDDFTHQGRRQQMPTQFLVNEGNRFVSANHLMKDPYWRQSHLGRSLIRLDHNRDGRMDVVVVDLSEPIALLENQTETPNQWIQFQLVGVASERDAIGAKVQVTSTSTQTAVVATGDGYQGRNEAVLAFGLAEHEGPVDVTLTWPSGKTQTWNDVATGRRYTLTENDSQLWP